MAMKVEIKDNKLCVEDQAWKNPHPLHPARPFIIADAHGDTVTTAVVNEKPVTIGLNAYIKK